MPACTDNEVGDINKYMILNVLMLFLNLLILSEKYLAKISGKIFVTGKV